MHKTYTPITFSVLLQLGKCEYENIQIKSKLLAKVGVFNIIFEQTSKVTYSFY